MYEYIYAQKINYIINKQPPNLPKIPQKKIKRIPQVQLNFHIYTLSSRVC